MIDFSKFDSLHHHRFARVEIIEHPTGKYQGYDVLVNLITVKNYEGMKEDWLPTKG